MSFKGNIRVTTWRGLRILVICGSIAKILAFVSLNIWRDFGDWGEVKVLEGGGVWGSEVFIGMDFEDVGDLEIEAVTVWTKVGNLSGKGGKFAKLMNRFEIGRFKEEGDCTLQVGNLVVWVI